MKKDLKEKTCCFTGHRDIPPEKIPVVRDFLREVLIFYINKGYLYFGAGGALGFDTVAAETVLSLRESYPEIKLILVLPCKNQTQYWGEKDVFRYNKILSQADKVKYTSELYDKGCMLKRNRHLVNHSSLCICYLARNNGGTAYTVNYAQKKGLKIVNLSKIRKLLIKNTF